MSLGITEILLILVVVVLLFGGKRIPEIARALGRASYEYKKAKNIIKDEANELKEAIEKEGEKPEEYNPKRRLIMATDKDESIISHIEAFREMLLKCLRAIAIVLLPMLFVAPKCLDIFIKLILKGNNIALNYFSPAEVFIIQIKFALVMDIIICFPYIAKQVWNFCVPALYEHEKKFIKSIVFTSSALFILGALFCLFVILPLIINFGMSFANQNIQAVFGISNVVTLALWLILAFGVMFQLPLVVNALIKSDIVEKETIQNCRPYVIVVLLILAGILTPPDVVSQIMLFTPTYLLFELGLLFSGKKKMSSDKYLELNFAKLDIDRQERRGNSEAVFCECKTSEQLIKIFSEFKNAGQNVLGTRATIDQAKDVQKALPDVNYNEQARTLTLIQNEVEKLGEVAICTGGTGDIPVAEEASETAQFFGSNVKKYYDVGIAGIHRLLDKIEDIKKANVIIAVAGMEGALGGVLAGMVDVPVIAVPTSVGYGSSFNGLSALLTMLNSCSEGMTVVNIDNGFNAGYSANQINRLIVKGANR